MLLAFDVAYSLLSTCQQPIYQSAAANSHDQGHCTAFGGLFFSLGILPIRHFLHTYEHELVAGFTVVLAFSTVALWLSTNKLWEATKDTATAQERDTRILQRAYISVEPGGISASSSMDKCHPNIDIRNVGNLPAREIRWLMEWSTSLNPRRQTFRIDPDKLEGQNTLTPGGVMRQGGPIIYLGNDHGDLRNEAGLYLYVWGAVYYDDGFGTERITKFCHRYNSVNLIKVTHETVEASGLMTFTDIGQEIRSSAGRYHRFGNDAT
jgi:hypothetical protein